MAHAEELGIEVVPEIDVPGHCFAMQQAIPELRDPQEVGSYYSVQGFPDNCVNPAREKTYEVLETIFHELIELFPFKTIHIGADEVPLGAWSGSPEALARLREIARRRNGRCTRQAPQRHHQHTRRRRHRRIWSRGSAIRFSRKDPAVPGRARLHHRRMGRGRARQRHRQDQKLSLRLA